MNQSEELARFYKALQEWIDSKFKENPHGFDSDCGLCSNLMYFLEDSLHASREMVEQFIAAGLHTEYPFNQHLWDYSYEMNKFTNPARLEWIKNHAAI